MAFMLLGSAYTVFCRIWKRLIIEKVFAGVKFSPRSMYTASVAFNIN